jgi:hypothetical protein
MAYFLGGYMHFVFLQKSINVINEINGFPEDEDGQQAGIEGRSPLFPLHYYPNTLSRNMAVWVGILE